MHALTLSLQFSKSLLDAGVQRAALPRHKVARWLGQALQSDAEITVRVVATEEALRLNRDFRQQDAATNVLTFAYAQQPVVSADLVLCAPLVVSEAQAQNKTLEQHYAHLLVHACLHAQGWDHELDAQAQAMELRESEIMLRLGFADPYLDGAGAALEKSV